MKNFLITEIDNLINMLRGIEKRGLRISQRIALEKSIGRLETIKRVIYYLLQ